MKKFVSVLMIFCIMLSLAACSSWSELWGVPNKKSSSREDRDDERIERTSRQTEQTTEPTEPTTESVEETTEPPLQEPPTFYLSKYETLAKDLVRLIRFAATSDDYTIENCPNLSAETQAMLSDLGERGYAFGNTMWEIAMYQMEPTDFGYVLHDLNADGIPEMFLVGKNRLLHAVFTCREDELIFLDSFATRYSGYVSQDNYLCTIGSGGAAISQHGAYTLEDGRLVEQAMLSTDGYSGGMRYYQNYNGGQIEITEETYNELLKRYHGAESSAWNASPIIPLPEVAVESTFESYLVSITRSDFPIWKEPFYGAEYSCSVGVSGTYTIVEETTDKAGNLWGKLKSGVGWIDLTLLEKEKTDPCVISVSYADNDLIKNGNYYYYNEGYSDYGVYLVFNAHETLTNVSLSQANHFDNSLMPELHYIEYWDESKPFVAYVSFPGDMSAYTLRFLDANNVLREFEVYMSGLDGSICLTECDPH